MVLVGLTQRRDPADMSAVCLSGAEAVEALGRPDVAALLASMADSYPVTAGPSWTRRWFEADGPETARLVLTRSSTGEPLGALVLSRRRVGPLALWASPGRDFMDYQALPSTSPDVMLTLFGQLRTALRADRVWRLWLDQLPADSDVGTAFRAVFPVARVEPGIPTLSVTADQGQPLNTVTTKSFRQTVRTAHNRAVREGRDLSVALSSQGGPVDLAELRALHLANDEGRGRRSRLEDPSTSAFWTGTLSDGLADGTVDVATLRVDGVLAAYMVLLRDGRAVRVWDAKYHPAYSVLSPGRVLALAAFTAAREADEVVMFDWMRGQEDYKRALACEELPSVRLRAWSHRALERLDDRRDRR